MEKTAQNPSGAPRRRRRRRGSGTGASQNSPAQNSASRESGKAAQPAAKEKTPRQPSHKENKETAPAVSSARGRHRGGQQSPAEAAPQPNGRRSRGSNGSGTPQPPAREQNHPAKAASRAARAQRRAAEEDPGLELITRRPPKQKFANFEEYLAAHGGMTVPLPEEEPALAPANGDAL